MLPISKESKYRQVHPGNGKLLALFRANPLRSWPLTAGIAMYFLLAGCATRRVTPPPAPVYPPTQESALRVLHTPPRGPYARIQTMTVAAAVGKQFESAVATVRQLAAQKGANALIVLHESEFWQNVGKRRIRVHRIIYLAIWQP